MDAGEVPAGQPAEEPLETAAEPANTVKKRPRASLDAQGLADILMPFMPENEDIWMYDVEPTTAKLNKEELMKWSLMFRALFEQSSDTGLNFTKALVMATLYELAKRKDWSIYKTQGKIESWAYTMQGRFRSMCRHVVRASSRKPAPKWGRELLGTEPAVPTDIDADDEDDDDDDEEIAAVTAASENVICGWDVFTHRAWRMVKGGVQEFAEKVFSKSEAADDDPAFAVWEDGMCMSLPDLSTLELKAVREAEKTKKTTPAIWTGKTGDEKPIVIKRLLRGGLPFFAVYEDGAQILQAKIVDDLEDDIQKLVVGLIEEYVAGNVPRAALKVSKDKAMKQLQPPPDANTKVASTNAIKQLEGVKGFQPLKSVRKKRSTAETEVATTMSAASSSTTSHEERIWAAKLPSMFSDSDSD